jgi:hypothetical protein
MRRIVADGYLCRDCSRVVSATKNNRYRSHKDRDGQTNCAGSSTEIPEDLLTQPPSDTRKAGVPEEGKDFAKCPQCGRNVTLTRLGYFPQHDTTLYGGEQCSTTGVRAFHAAAKTADLPLPGDSLPEKGVDRAVRPKVSNQLEVERERVGRPMKELESAPPASSGASTDSDSPASTTSSGEPPPKEDPLTPEEIAEAFEVPAGMLSPESTEKSSVGSEPNVTSNSSLASLPVFTLGRKLSELIRQPDSPFLQPPEWKEPPTVFLQPPAYGGPEKADPMEGGSAEIATRFREIFYSHSNRRTTDNRSAQTTLGPSEIGTPCDRRLAMALLNVEPVNPGGDGWAAWVGTQGHAGLEQMFSWASANTGRFATEVRLKFPSEFVPRGTSDLFDRMYGEVWDFKFMGEYSLKKFKLEGPSETYRIQGHVYGLGQQLAGEKVKKVAILGLPRAGGSLDGMHVWSEKFDRKVAEKALKRVDDIAARVEEIRRLDGLGSMPSPMATAQTFSTADARECKWCPFSNPRDKGFQRGCPGP